MASLVALRDRGGARQPGPLLSRAARATLDRLCDRGELELDPALLADLARAAAGRGLTAELPGQVYEAALGSRARRRARGTFYTPDHLVARVLTEALAPALGPSLPRVLDPACGGGAFLVAAYRALAAAVPAARGPRARARAVLDRLRGCDVDRTATQVARLALALAAGGVATAAELGAAVVHGDALRLADALGPVDVVVGNPPWGQKHFRARAADLAHYRAHYATARGVLDPFALFVELALRVLAPGGRYGLVLPDIVLLKRQEPVRRLLLAHTIDFLGHAGQAFAGAHIDCVVVAGRRGPAPPDHVVRICRGLTADGGAPLAPGCPQAVFARQPGQRLNLHLDPAAIAELDRLAALPRLADRFELHEGVHSGNRRAQLFVAAPGPSRHPLVVGRGELGRFALRWAGRYLETDPRAIDRAAGHYANLGRPEWHLVPKIVVRRTGDHVVAALDRVGRYVSNNAFVVLPRRPAILRELAATVALLNSSFMTWYFRAVMPRQGRRFAELKIQHLGGFPLPPAARWTPAVVARLAGHARALERGPAPAALAALDREVDRLYRRRAADLYIRRPARAKLRP